MKKLILAFTMVTSILVVSACSNKDVSDASDVIASTKAGDITKADLYDEMKDSIGAEVLENLILLKAIENEYEVTDTVLKNEIESRKEQYGDNFELYLAQNNLTEQAFDKKIKFSLYQQKMIESLDEVTDEEINAEYENMKKEIHARHILVKDKKTAEEVIAKLKDGGDFGELAREFSTEPIAQETGGDLGWFGPGRMLQPFEDAAFLLAKNEISEPVQTIYGFHVIEVIDTRHKELEKTLEELTPEIQDRLKEKLFEEKLVVLLKNVGVDIKDDEFKSVLKGYITTADKK